MLNLFQFLFMNNNLFRGIAPSILSADFGNLQREITWLNQSSAHFLHVDIMDGIFVPNISFGFDVLKIVKKFSNKPLDVHLMIQNPERYLTNFKEAGADLLTVHYEENTHLHRTLKNIKNLGMQTGVALNPHTPVEVLTDILAEIDLICLMSVNPGFGGQTFILQTFNKIQRLKQMMKDQNIFPLLEVDGGVDLNNVKELWDLGVNVVVAGSSIFRSENPKQYIETMLSL